MDVCEKYMDFWVKIKYKLGWLVEPFIIYKFNNYYSPGRLTPVYGRFSGAIPYYQPLCMEDGNYIPLLHSNWDDYTFANFDTEQKAVSFIKKHYNVKDHQIKKEWI